VTHVPDSRGGGRRPALVIVATLALTAIGIGLVAAAVLDAADLVAAFLREPAVDGMTFLVNGIITAFVLAIFAAVAGVGVLHLLVAWRAWRGVPWAWVEGIVAALIGAGLHVLSLTSEPVPGPRAVLEVPLALAGIVLAGVAVGSLASARDAFGPWRWPRTPAEAPFWLRPASGYHALFLPPHDADRREEEDARYR
jgi:hypothetical protein